MFDINDSQNRWECLFYRIQNVMISNNFWYAAGIPLDYSEVHTNDIVDHRIQRVVNRECLFVSSVYSNLSEIIVYRKKSYHIRIYF